jgi:hypothetical protein
LRSVLMLAFDCNHTGDEDSSAIPSETCTPFCCVLWNLNPLLAAYMDTFVLPSLSIQSGCPDNTCINKESLFSNSDLVQADLLAACSPFISISTTLRGQVRQWKPLACLHTNVPNFHRALALSSIDCDKFVSNLLKAVEDGDGDGDSGGQAASGGVTGGGSKRRTKMALTVGRSTPAHRALMTYDVIILIMSFLSSKRICRLMCVNKALAAAGRCPQLWHEKYSLRWPLTFHQYNNALEESTAVVGMFISSSV